MKKLKYIRTFEQYQESPDFGRFNNDEIDQDERDETEDFRDENTFGDEDDLDFNDESEQDEEIDFEDFEEDNDRCTCPECNCGEEEEEESDRNWGDDDNQVVEKKMNKGFADYLAKKKAASKKSDKKCDDKKCGCNDKKGKKEEKEEKGKKGLTAGQKKLPKAMQDAILKKMNK